MVCGWSGASWRLALKLATRTSIRSFGRSALIVAMVALPITGLAGIAVVTDSMYSPSLQQRIDTELGNTQAKILMVAPPGSGLRQDPIHPDWIDGAEWTDNELVTPKEALPSGTRIITLSSTSVTAKTAAGIGRIPVREGESWDPSLSGRNEVTAGRIPHNDHEVMVTAALLPRTGAKIGDTVELPDAVNRNGDAVPSVTIVGVLKDHTLPDSAEQFYAMPGALSDNAAQNEPQSDTYYLPDTPLNWDEVKKLNAEGLTVLSRAVLLDPPPNDGTFPPNNQFSSVLAAGALLAILAAFAAFEVILLAGAAFTVTARQQQRTLATIASVGAPRKLLFRILTANGIVLGAIGGLVGVGLGIGAGAIFMAITADGSSTQYYGLHLPWLGFLAAVAFAVLIGWLASLVPARATSRFDVVAALRGARKPPTPNRRRPIVGLILLVSGIALTLVGGMLLAILTDIEHREQYGSLQWLPVTMLIVGPILALVGLILIGPLLLRGIAKLLDGSGLGARLASRDSARNPGRAVPALAAVMTTVFVAVFGMSVAAGSEASTLDIYQWRMPLGGIRVALDVSDYGDGSAPPTMTTYGHPELVENAIRTSMDVDHVQTIASVPDWDSGNLESDSAEEAPAAIINVPGEYLCPIDPRSPEYLPAMNDYATPEARAAEEDPRCQGGYFSASAPGINHIFVSDTAGLALALGHEPSATTQRALETGGAVSLYPQYVQDGKISISWWTPQQVNDLYYQGEDPGKPTRTESLDAVVDQPANPIYFGVFISPSTADRMGLEYHDSVVLASTKTMPTTQQQDSLREAMSALPDNNHNGSLIHANVEMGPADFAGPIAWGLLGLAGLIAIASSAIAIGLARFDGRQDDATLSALGAGRVVRRNFAFWQAIIIAGIGSVLGAAIGLVPAWALDVTGLPFTPPWIPIGVAVVALPLLIACGSWLLASRNRVSARRVAIA